MNIQSAKGVTLIHVMVLMALLGAILVSEIQKRQSFSDTHAFYYTIAQTQMALNNAFGEVNSSGNWPGSAGGCVTNPDTLNNGWGMRLYCVHEGTTAYRIIQYLPSHLGGLFLEEFSSDSAATASAVAGYALPAGFAAYSVRVDRSGGAEQRVDFTVLSGDEHNSAEVEEIDCPIAKPAQRAFVALGGMQAQVHSTQQVAHIFHGACFWPVTVAPPAARLGFELNAVPRSSSAPIEITYNMYRQGFSSAQGYNVDNSAITESTVSTAHWGCDLIPIGYPDYWTDDGSDGHQNAQHQVNGDSIRVATFQYCD